MKTKKLQDEEDADSDDLKVESLWGILVNSLQL